MSKGTLLRVTTFFIISAVYLLIFSSAFSPLYDDPGMDSLQFLLMASAWLHGHIPYLELFDHKGPVLYMIYMAGLAINRSFGILIIQTIMLTFDLELLWRIGRMIVPGKKGYICVGIATVLLVFTQFICEGMMTEEISLPFILLPTLLYVRDVVMRRNHPLGYAFVYGLCFGILTFIRLNNALINAGLIIGLSFLMIRAREYRLLALNGVAFILGFLVTVTPILLYFAWHGALEEMIYAVFQFNIAYAAKWTSLLNLSLLFISLNAIRLLPALLLIPVGYIFWRRNKYLALWPGLATASILFFLANLKTAGYGHYFTIEIPLIFIVTIMTLAYFKTVMAVLIIVTCFILPSVRLYTVNQIFHHDNSGVMKAVQTGYDTMNMFEKYIPESERNDIYTYDLYYENRAFLLLDITPASKHPFMGSAHSQVDHRVAKEISEEMDSTNIGWILINKDSDTPDIRHLLSRYESVDSVGRGVLYRLKSKKTEVRR